MVGHLAQNGPMPFWSFIWWPWCKVHLRYKTQGPEENRILGWSFILDPVKFILDSFIKKVRRFCFKSVRFSSLQPNTAIVRHCIGLASTEILLFSLCSGVSDSSGSVCGSVCFLNRRVDILKLNWNIVLLAKCCKFFISSHSVPIHFWN